MTGKKLGPRSSAFGAFEIEPVERPVGPVSPPTSKTTNGAGVPSSPPHEVTRARERVVVSVAVEEVLGFAAGLLSKVPAPWSMHCTHDGDAFVVTNSKACYREARDDGVPVLLGGEWYALAHAAQNDRAWSRELRGWIERKRAASDWRLTHARAFGGMPIGNAVDLEWSVGEVLSRLDATLVRIEVRT